MLEARPVDAVERTLAGVAEGRVPKIMPQRNGLGQILVELQRPCRGAGKAGDLKGVRQPCAVMVALGLEVNLRLVLQAAEGFRVGYPVDIALEAGAYLALGLAFAPAL